MANINVSGHVGYFDKPYGTNLLIGVSGIDIEMRTYSYGNPPPSWITVTETDGSGYYTLSVPIHFNVCVDVRPIIPPESVYVCPSSSPSNGFSYMDQLGESVDVNLTADFKTTNTIFLNYSAGPGG